VNPYPSDQSEEIDYLELDDIIEKQFDNDKENLIMILQEIQWRYNYIPGPAIEYLAEKLDIPLSQIYGVGTFYRSLSLEPRGKHIISVCRGTACHVRGAEKVLERITDNLSIRDGQTTQDGQFTLESVRCIGCCSLGPVIKIDEDIHGLITSDKVGKVLRQYGNTEKSRQEP
jgi:NADH:ubiquinone oxidoreductase subunit E